MTTAMSIGYFGTQSGRQRQRLCHMIRELQPRRYVDLTAGGASIPCSVNQEIGPIGVNDICGYAHLAHKALFATPTIPSNVNFKEMIVEGEQCKPVNGYMTRMVNIAPNKAAGSVIPVDIARHIDGLVVGLNHHGCHLAQVAIGKALMNLCTFRGMMWCGTSTDPDHKYVRDFTWDFIAEKIEKEFLRLRQWHHYRPENIATCLDADDFLKDYDASGDVVYADPAWPWIQGQGEAKKEQDNPYYFVVNVLSELIGCPSAPFQLWTQDSPILQTIEEWARVALEHGAKVFILSTQSSNHPPVELVQQHMQERFELGVESVAGLRGTGGGKWHDYFFTCRLQSVMV